MSNSAQPHRRQPTRLPRPWDSPGKNTGVGCHFLLQRMKVKSDSEVAQLCPTLSDPMDCSLPGSFVHGIFQARVLEWGAIAFSSWRQQYSVNLCCTGLCLTHVLSRHRAIESSGVALRLTPQSGEESCPLFLRKSGHLSSVHWDSCLMSSPKTYKWSRLLQASPGDNSGS